MTKNAIIFAMTLTMLFTICFTSGHNARGAEEIKIYLNEEALETEVPPHLTDGRVLAPFRSIFEALGARVRWVPESKEVIGEIFDDKEEFKLGINLTIESNQAIVICNETQTDTIYYLDMTPIIIEGRAFIPLRFVSESLGAIVEWDAEQRAVIIKSREQPFLNNSKPDKIDSPENEGNNNKKWKDFIWEDYPGYTFKYPVAWELYFSDSHKTAFTTPEGASFVVLTEATTIKGGEYSNINEATEGFRQQYLETWHDVSNPYSGSLKSLSGTYPVIMFNATSPDKTIINKVIVTQRDENYFHIIVFSADPQAHVSLAPVLQNVVNTFSVVN